MRMHASPSPLRPLQFWFDRWHSIALWVIGGLLLCGAFAPAPAQIDVPDVQGLSTTSQVSAGVRLLQQGQTRKAISVLQSVLETDSTATVPSYGSAAYWLGEAYARAGQSKKAESIWRTGLRDLRAARRFDVRLADAYLRHVAPKQLRGERLYAVDVYRSLLRRVRPDTPSAVRTLFRRRVAQVAPLMSDTVLSRVIEEDRSTKAAKWTFKPGAGSTLVEWWSGLDPLPATDANERLEEHLTRLVHARREYRCSERVSDLDERGIVYLRFGAPYKRRPIDYEDAEFFKEVYRFGVNVPPSSFPETEIWLYTHIDESGFYLFAEADTSDCYVMTRANELMPDHLTMSRGNTKRGLNIAYSALMAMRAIYRELALYHINFGSRYAKIANYAAWQEMKAARARAAKMTGGEYQPSAGERSVTVGAGVGQTRRVFANPALGIEYPTRFVPRMVARARQEDRAAAERRKKAMPRQHTTLLEGSAQLPVAVRTARFLNEDGTTRTEIYWGVPASGLRLSEKDTAASETSLVTFSAVQYDAHHQSQQRKRRRYRINVQPKNDPRMIVPPTLTFEGATDLYHLGMQWGQYELWQNDTSSAKGAIGQKRRLATARADSLKPLRAEGPRVEMSDVKVMTLPDTSARTLANPLERAQPYPFRTLSADMPLLLSFELYHLSYGSDDRTHYTVSYEAEGQTRRGWKGLFLGEETQRTSTEMTMEGSARRTQETILLDLSKLNRDNPQDVRVTVQVTDEVTGTTVSRSVSFVLRPRDASN